MFKHSAFSNCLYALKQVQYYKKDIVEGASNKELYGLIDELKKVAKLLAEESLNSDPNAITQLGVPTHECFNCKSNIFTIQVTFDDYEIGLMWPEGTCVMCGSVVTTPAPWHHPYWDEELKEIVRPLPPVEEQE